jgi:hypothetical protein
MVYDPHAVQTTFNAFNFELALENVYPCSVVQTSIYNNFAHCKTVQYCKDNV